MKESNTSSFNNKNQHLCSTVAMFHFRSNITSDLVFQESFLICQNESPSTSINIHFHAVNAESSVIDVNEYDTPHQGQIN